MNRDRDNNYTGMPGVGIASANGVQKHLKCILISLLLAHPMTSLGETPPEFDRLCASFLHSDPLTRALSNREIGRLKLQREEKARYSSAISAIQRGDWADNTFDPAITPQAQVPRIALHAYLNKQITLEQFVTQSIRWAALSDFAPLDVNEIRPEAVLNADGTPTVVMIDRILHRWPFKDDPHSAAQFLEKVRRLPRSEQTVWSYRSKRHPKANDSLFWNVLAGEISVFFNEANGHSVVRFPSYGLIAAYMEVVFGKNKFHLIPQLGISDNEEVKRGLLEGGRVLTLHLFGVPGVRKAHGGMGKLESISHDLCHAIEGAAMPLAYRLALVRFAELRKKATANALSGLVMENSAIFPARAFMRLTRPIHYRFLTITQFISLNAFDDIEPQVLDLNFGRYFLESAASDRPPKNLDRLIRDMQKSATDFFTRDFRGMVHFASSIGSVVEEGSPNVLLFLWDMIENPKIYAAMGLDLQAIAHSLRDPDLQNIFLIGLGETQGR